MKFFHIFCFPVTIQNGVPQSATMSTTLFLIEINDVTFNLKPSIEAHLFADGITITYSGKNVHSINEHSETAIKSAADPLGLVKHNWPIFFSSENPRHPIH